MSGRHSRSKRRHKRCSSSGSDNSHRSSRKLLTKGLTYSRPQPTRRAVRHTSLEGPPRPKDATEAMADRLGALADRDDRRSGAPSKVDQFTVCALRGFGVHRVVLGTGTYGAEMESCIRTQARSEKDKLRHDKLRVPISNRIARAASSGAFGCALSEGTDEISVCLSGCIALDSSRYKTHRWGGEKIEPIGKNPHSTGCFVSTAKQHIRLFCFFYGHEHGKERERWRCGNWFGSTISDRNFLP